jgi:hypothetical protein
MGQKVSVNLDPAVDFDFQCFDEVSQIDFNPSFFNWSLDFSDLSLDDFQVGDFFIKKVEWWNGLSASFQKNVFFFEVFFAFNNFDFWEIQFQELNESFLWTVFPKVRVLFEVSFDGFGIFDNCVKIVRDFGHGVLNIEIGSAFDQIISGGGTAAGSLSCRVKSWEIMSNGEDFVDPSFENVTDTSDASFRLFNFRIVDDTLFAFKFKLNFKQLRLVVFFGVNLLIQVVQGKNDTIANSVSHNCVDVLSVFFPFWLLFVELNSIVDFLQKFMNNNTAIFHAYKLVCDNGFQDVVILFGRDWFIFSINHWLSELSKLCVDEIQGFFHLVHDFKQTVNNVLCLVDKRVDFG